MIKFMMKESVGPNNSALNTCNKLSLINSDFYDVTPILVGASVLVRLAPLTKSSPDGPYKPKCLFDFLLF